jgi:protein-S-isoprenylcysteine O-methyltransferase Ste14
VQLRTTGRSGFVGLRAAKSPLERAAAGLFVAALSLGLAAPLLGMLSPGSASSTPLLRDVRTLALGGLLYASGLALTLAAQRAMGRSWRIGVDARERTALVTSGPFQLVRNPIFGAMVITGTGIVLLFASSVALLAYVCLAVALELQVRAVEEPYLLRTHGEAYRTYAQRTGRFFPWIGVWQNVRVDLE